MSTEQKSEIRHQIACQVVRRDEALLLECLFALPSDARVRFYKERLELWEVQRYKAQQKVKRAGVLLIELNAFFDQHPNTGRYSAPHLQTLISSLEQELMELDKEAIADIDLFLQIREVHTTKKIYRAGDVQEYMRDFRPREFASPEVLATLTKKIESLDTSHKLRLYISEGEEDIVNLQQAEFFAQSNVDTLAMEYSDYLKEEYPVVHAQERRDRERKVDLLLNEENMPWILETLQCVDVKKAREFLTAKDNDYPTLNQKKFLFSYAQTMQAANVLLFMQQVRDPAFVEADAEEEVEEKKETEAASLSRSVRAVVGGRDGFLPPPPPPLLDTPPTQEAGKVFSADTFMESP